MQSLGRNRQIVFPRYSHKGDCVFNFEMDLVRADEHFKGKGFKEGSHIESILRLLRDLSDRHFDDRCSLELILSGCCWTNSRLNIIKSSFSPYCQRCDSNAFDTDLHCYWECPADAHLNERDIDKSAHLSTRASAECAQFPCLWFRGLLPRSMIIVIPRPPDSLHIKYVNPDEVQWGSGNDYGDASGGEYTSFHDLRRVGCSVVHCVADGLFFSFSISQVRFRQLLEVNYIILFS